VDAYRQATENLRSALSAFRASRSLIEGWDHPSILRDVTLAKELQFWLPLPEGWRKAQDPARYFFDIEKMARHFHNAAGIRGDLLKQWTPEFLNQDGKTLAKEWDDATGKWLLPRFFGQSGLIRRLGAFAKIPVEKVTLREQLTTLIAYQDEQTAAATNFETYGPELGNLYQGDATDWQLVGDTAANARRSAEALGDVSRAANAESVNGLCAAWADFENAKDGLSLLVTLAEDAAGSDYLQKQTDICDPAFIHPGGNLIPVQPDFQWLNRGGILHFHKFQILHIRKRECTELTKTFAGYHIGGTQGIHICSFGTFLKNLCVTCHNKAPFCKVDSHKHIS
jgi:hypothetical protein